mgnify:CR=1 FL=1
MIRAGDGKGFSRPTDSIATQLKRAVMGPGPARGPFRRSGGYKTQPSASEWGDSAGDPMPVIRFVREGRDVECYPGGNVREVARREGVAL